MKKGVTETLSRRLRCMAFWMIVMIVLRHSQTLDIRFTDAPRQEGGCVVRYVQILVSRGIARTALPIFFGISGFLFFIDYQSRWRWVARRYLRRSRTLVVPYLLWSALGILVYLLLQSIPGSEGFFTREDDIVRSWSFSSLLRRWLLQPVPEQLWFIRDLIVLVIISPALYYLISYARSLILVPLFVLWLLHVHPLPVVGNHPVLSDVGLLFFCLGGYLGIWKPICMERSCAKAWLLVVCWLVLVAYEAAIETLGTPRNVILHRLSIAVGVLAIWFNWPTWRRVAAGKIVLWCARHTFFVYACHMPLVIMIKKLIARALGRSSASLLLVYMLAPLFTIGLCIVGAQLLLQFAPSVYGILTGDRGLSWPEARGPSDLVAAARLRESHGY